MKLIAGLGNPGRDYEATRHNVGFMVVDALASDEGLRIDRKKFRAELCEGSIEGVQALLLKPQTYMNLSGEAVGAAARFYKIEPEDVLVVHDDLDLELGRIQIKIGGGHGGHNGLRSLIAHIGPDFARLRIGIGKPGPGRETVGHVLGGFAKSEEAELDFALSRAQDAIRCVLQHGPQACMNEFNKRSVEG